MNVNKKRGPVKVRHPLLLLEDGLVHCRFGKFHMRLILASFVSTFAATTVTSTSSYLLPNAGCDLNMSIMQKGLLNAGPLMGSVIATLLSCFFVDVFGRKTFLIYGHTAIFIFTVLEASSQNYWSLLMMKVLEGASSMLCVFAVLIIVPELTLKEQRTRIGMLIVSFMPLALIGEALISWGLLPHAEWHFVIWKGYFELHAWNIYLYVCSVFSLLATVLYLTIPESPTYLLLQGKEDEALEILKSVYSENTGNDRETFPIKTLGSIGILPARRSIKALGMKYLNTLKLLFRKPRIYQIMLFSWFSFVSHMIYNTIRLWYPQISTIVEFYRKENGNTDSFCIMLNHYTNNFNTRMSNITTSDVCVPTPSGPETYVNIIVVASVTFFAINVSGYLVNFLGPKLLMGALFLLGAVSSGTLYLMSSSHQIALMVAAICGFMRATLGLQKTALTSFFPPPLKALGLSIIILWSRVGALLGNIIFPALLQIDCLVPFLTFSIILLCTSALVYFMPSKKNNVDN